MRVRGQTDSLVAVFMPSAARFTCVRAPFTFQVEKVKEEDIPPRDPKNYLCPGSKRTSGEVRAWAV